MTTVAIFDAKTRLSELLVQAQAGHEITITRHGVPVARLVPPKPLKAAARKAERSRAVQATFAALADLRKGVSLDIPLREALENGRD
jgi:prevent-host-death family protein